MLRPPETGCAVLASLHKEGRSTLRVRPSGRRPVSLQARVQADESRVWRLEFGEDLDFLARSTLRNDRGPAT